MNVDIVFGLIGIVMFTGASYYAHRILENFENDSRVASSMFFLKDSSSDTFMTVSILVFTVLTGEILILAANYATTYSSELIMAGRASLLVSMAAAVYFVKSVNSITKNPSQE